MNTPAQVLLKPCGDPAALSHFENTIQQQVPLQEIRSLIPANLHTHLAALFPEGRASMWGVTTGGREVNKNKWDRVVPGAICLFAGAGRIFGRGTVAAKFHSPRLANYLWGEDSNGNSWEWMYALTELKEVAIPYASLAKVLGYKPGFKIQGFNVLDEAKSRACIEHFGLQSDRTDWPDDPAQIEAAIKGLDELDRVYERLHRAEQAALRNQLLHGKRTGNCRICQRDYNADFLVAAHIKKRAECSRTEKRDLANIAMLACRFGCDELYERGFIAYEKSGAILISPKLTDPNAAAYAKDLPAKIAIPEQQSRYFAWHREQTYRK